MYFLDTGVFTDHDIPSDFWNALLSRRVVITPWVLYELRHWLRDPFYNRPVRDALQRSLRSPSWMLSVYDTTTAPWNLRRAAQYYIELLSVRKSHAVMLQDEYVSMYGHLPPEGDDSIQRKCQRKTGDRGWRLAKKGLADWGKLNFSTDEELVVWAVLTALWDSREVVIITRDADVMEQFYKLIYLLDTHYRSMLVAAEYSIAPWRFPTTPISKEWRCSEAFLGDDARLIRLPSWKSDWMLPNRYRPVVIYCWLLGGPRDALTFQPLSFCAETSMNQLVDMKSMAGGRNTNRLGGENCHFCVDPLAQGVLFGMAAVGMDKTFNMRGTQLPFVDTELALRSKEGLSRSEISPIWYQTA